MTRSARAAIAGLVLLFSSGCATGQGARSQPWVMTAPQPPTAAPPQATVTEQPEAPTAAPPRTTITEQPEAPAPAPPQRTRRSNGFTAADYNYFEGVAMLEEGKCRRALDRFAATWKENPGYPGVERNISTALEGLKKKGDDALREGHPEKAGRRYAAALRFLSHPAVRDGSVTFTKGTLQKKIDKISAALMEKGLADYRQGKLKEAIAIWREILAYDPAHKEAAKSVKTATTQLKNLKKLTPPPAPK